MALGTVVYCEFNLVPAFDFVPAPADNSKRVGYEAVGAKLKLSVFLNNRTRKYSLGFLFNKNNLGCIGIMGFVLELGNSCENNIPRNSAKHILSPHKKLLAVSVVSYKAVASCELHNRSLKVPLCALKNIFSL